MRIALTAALALLTLAPAGARACLNEMATDRAGRPYSSDGLVGASLVYALTHPYRDPKMDRFLIQETRKDPSFRNLNDIGVLLVRQGKLDAALRHFRTVERLFPGQPQTAANLGTALELAGQDKEALHWIRTGLQRNPREHYGSEWLHVRILEAKIAAAGNPAYFRNRSIAGIAFGPGLVPAFPRKLPNGNDGKPLLPSWLDSSLDYQLHERIGLVKAPDPVVANLLSDWATLHLSGGSMETAKALYELAATYGAPRDALMQRRIAHIDQVVAKAEKRPTPGEPDCRLCGWD